MKTFTNRQEAYNSLFPAEYRQALKAIKGLSPKRRAALGLSDIQRAATAEANQLVQEKIRALGLS